MRNNGRAMVFSERAILARCIMTLLLADALASLGGEGWGEEAAPQGSRW